jgi:hypothetical protein
MSYENSAGLGIHTQYGARRTGGAVGHILTDGAVNQLTVELTPDNILNGGFVPPLYLPDGSYIKNAFVRVTQGFTFVGTTNTINVGTSGSEATNGLTITQAQLASVGTFDLSAALAGTWKVTAPANGSVTEVAGGVLVGVVQANGATGGLMTAGVGRAEIVIEYFHVVR